MPRVLLLGAGGQLGMQLARRLAGEVELVALTRSELDFTNERSLRAAIFDISPEIAINAAAYTAVDKAESEPGLCAQVNASAPAVLADALARTNGWLIHYSTDYVFDGTGTEPWRETDATGPLSVYGQTKLDGELAIAATGCRHVILRTSWVYAEEGRNFLHTMLRLGRERDLLKVVDDQIGAPTTAEAIAAATMVVLRQLAASEDARDAVGVYHLTCAGATSWCGFAHAIFAEFAARQKAPVVMPIPTEAYPTPAKRPRNSRLCCDKFFGRFGYRMPEWQDALRDVARAMLSKA
ncbi:dTDP-4-dehydrorhamnose reductase [Acidicapsa acidisoli]|uniref:dTDP-4-dehydrorhamnose reductase n=1 Tax=Acidicapsa acidisoli TaxID=1615681 RepID=UPI0021E06AF8|nr:dTDP-4-dehydrorhamnose reductase [Acidicapsa acidisoli]